MAALSGRPPRPQPAHRFAALGGVLLGIGLVLLAFADQRRVGVHHRRHRRHPDRHHFPGPARDPGPRRAPAAVRPSRSGLALRDLARYQARSGAALGAITLAVGIAATIAISASAAQTPTGAGNLPANQLMLYSDPGRGGEPRTAGQRGAAAGGRPCRRPARRGDARGGRRGPRSGVQPQGGVVAPPGRSRAAAPPGYLTAVLAKVIENLATGEHPGAVAPVRRHAGRARPFRHHHRPDRPGE